MRTTRHRFMAAPLLAAFALAGSLAACSSHPAAPEAATPTNTAAEAVAQPGTTIAMGCADGKAEWAIGEQISDALAAKAKTDAEAKVVRVIKPGHPVTLEYNGSRLNLHTDTKGMVERVSCG